MKRGRTSEQERETARERLSVVSFLPGERPGPPEELNEAQAETWKAVVATKPWDWFGPASWPVLTSYCRAVDACAALAKEIDKATAKGGAHLVGVLPLMTAQERQVRIILATATKMRLTHQSIYRGESAAAQSKVPSTPAAKRKPWAQ